MKVRCVWEHNGNDSLLYAVDYPGAYTRGKSREEALAKMPGEIRSYLAFRGDSFSVPTECEIVQEKTSDLAVSDADSDVLFDEERKPLSRDEYAALKALALKSADDFLALYHAVPDKDVSPLPSRETFYGHVPRTAREMYEHTKSVNAYYFAEIGIEADNGGEIGECRRRGFERLEQRPDYLENRVFDGSYGEEWSLRKVLRRFIWHDRIHAKAMYRMAKKAFGADSVPDVFSFEGAPCAREREKTLVKTERMTVRLIEEDDSKQIARILEDFNRSEYARYDRPHDTDENAVRSRVARWAAASASGTDHLFFAVCLGDTVIGYCAFNKRDDGYEIGYCFDSSYHGKGYAEESLSAMIGYLRKKGITRFTAGTALANVKSVSLLRSLGFRQTGVEKVSFYKDKDGNDILFDGGIFELTFCPENG